MSLKKKKNVYFTLSDYGRHVLGRTTPPIPPTPPNSPLEIPQVEQPTPIDAKPIEKNNHTIESKIKPIKTIEEPYNIIIPKEPIVLKASPKRTSFSTCSLM